MPLLTAQNPKDWSDLQDRVAEILEECGLEAEVQHTLEAARGTVEVDVYAVEKVDGRTTTIAFECKHWRTRVPKAVVQTFRTVLADLGVNAGYIISSSGFQAGAHSVAAMTNLRLLTWQEFQKEFSQTWLQNYLVPQITEGLDTLLSYTEPLVPDWFLNVPNEDKDVLRLLRSKHLAFSALMMQFTRYGRILRDVGFPDLPLRDRLEAPFADTAWIPDGILDAVGYRDLLSLVLEHSSMAVEEFDIVRRKHT